MLNYYTCIYFPCTTHNEKGYLRLPLPTLPVQTDVNKLLQPNQLRHCRKKYNVLRLPLEVLRSPGQGARCWQLPRSHQEITILQRFLSLVY